LGPLGNRIYRMSSLHSSASCRPRSASCRPRFHFIFSSLPIS
ncbi:hypothetical protein T4D_6899, partial [Trichinella pseudospiralis]